MSARESRQFGDWFEGIIAALLKQMTEMSFSKHYRYPDKKSTGGGYANKQPADFFLLTQGMHIDIECKSSVVHTDFKKCFKGLIKDHQIAASVKTKRAGGRYLFLFCSKDLKMVEIWDAADLREAYSMPRMKLKGEPMSVLPFNDTMSEFLAQFTKG